MPAFLLVFPPCAALAGTSPPPSQEGQGTRIALVIGNADYQQLPGLQTPVAEALQVGAALAARGFTKVSIERNLTQAALLEVLQKFQEQAAGVNLALIYVASSGARVEGERGVFPVDTPLKPDALRKSMVPVSRLLEAASAAHRSVVVVDACNSDMEAERVLPHRGAPLDTTVANELSQVRLTDGHQLLVYSAAPGEVSMDSIPGSPVGPFAQASLRALDGGPIRLGDWLAWVSQAVKAATGGRQHIWIQGSPEVLGETL